jgi:hypothetical protein
MLRKLIVAALASILIAGGALAQAKFGTANEAKAMLEKAVAAIKADKAKALDMFLKGEGRFKAAIFTRSASISPTARFW